MQASSSIMEKTGAGVTLGGLKRVSLLPEVYFI